MNNNSREAKYFYREDAKNAKEILIPGFKPRRSGILTVPKIFIGPLQGRAGFG